MKPREDVQKLVKRRNDLRKQRAALIESIPTVMVMQENPTPNKTHILNRGQYDQPGEVGGAKRAGVPSAIAFGCSQQSFGVCDVAR